MKLIFNFIVLTLIFIGCGNSNEEIKTKDDERYRKILVFFGDSLINHFPHDDNFRNSETIDTFCYHNTLSFQLALFDAKSQIDSILKLHSDSILVEYGANDTCLLVVNDYVNKRNRGDSFRAGESTYIKGCPNNKYPVPNFWASDLGIDSTRSKLPKDFIFYVLDSRVGVFSKKINIEQSSMPDYIKHGYSKGYAISKERQIIIYWIIIW